MCGIFCTVGENLNEQEFKSYLNLISHRGPDDIRIRYLPKENVFLGHCRLSILDLNITGSQPMKSTCENYEIIYNGEIYNFEELKRYLPNKFKSIKSDTRILIELISSFGIKFVLEKLDGMFAFAVYDHQRKIITFARDRFGEKPLYYGKFGNSFTISSELKPIISRFKNKLSLNSNSISNFIKYNYIPSSKSIFNEVSHLSPGHYAEFHLKEKLIKRETQYWHPSQKKIKLNISHNEAQEEFHYLFNESVKRRCISDAPLGAFLSGGYDSTAIVSAMRKLNIGKIKTFTIGFEENDFNEAPFAKKIANFLETDHNELYIPSSKAIDVIPKISKIYDEPFSDVSQIPTFLLSELASKNVSVVLSGDGGDELFAGYSRYTMGREIWKKLSYFPLPLRNFISSIISKNNLKIFDNINNYLPNYFQIKNYKERYNKIIKILKSKSDEEFYNNLISHDLTPNEVLLFDVEDFSQELIPDQNFIASMMHSDLKNYLPYDILTKVDRASMANSLECRAPFLSEKIYDFAQKIPFDFMYKKHSGKLLIKEYVHKQIPNSLVERPKMGFGVPISNWLKNDLRPWVEDTLNESDLISRGIFKVDSINKLKKDTYLGKGNKHYSLWNVLILSQWLQDYNFSL